VPQDECFAAGEFLSKGLISPPGIMNNDLNVDDWNYTPCGCFFWNREERRNVQRSINYDLGNGPCINSNLGSLICKEPQSSTEQKKNGRI